MKIAIQLNLLRFIAIPAFAFLLIQSTCKKEDAPAGPGSQTGTLTGYWKGNTTTPGGFDNALNGLNYFIRSNGTARCFYSSVQRPLNDTSANDVLKGEGTYTLSGTAIVLTTSAGGSIITSTGTLNSGITSMQGSFKFDIGGLIVNQNFIIKK